MIVVVSFSDPVGSRASLLDDGIRAMVSLDSLTVAGSPVGNGIS